MFIIDLFIWLSTMNSEINNKMYVRRLVAVRAFMMILLMIMMSMFIDRSKPRIDQIQVMAWFAIIFSCLYFVLSYLINDFIFKNHPELNSVETNIVYYNRFMNVVYFFVLLASLYNIFMITKLQPLQN
jgi:MFS-type transporter involved in bile tolerance (Atg22 family)